MTYHVSYRPIGPFIVIASFFSLLVLVLVFVFGSASRSLSLCLFHLRFVFASHWMFDRRSSHK
jgi:hypothetical protein